MGEEPRIPKPPTIASIWGFLDDKERDDVTALFLTWLIKASESVRSTDDLIQLANMVMYHSDDLLKIVKNALKEEFRDLAEEVAKLLGWGL